MVTRAEIIDRAATEIASRMPVAALSAAKTYADTLYDGAVTLLLRSQDWEFARFVETLVSTGGTAPLGWAEEYAYPESCLRVRQIVPGTIDPFDPVAVVWDVGTALVSATQTRVIWANEADAQIVYTTSDVTEDEWDSIFAETMTRYLASMMAMPVGGRPDFARELLNQAGGLGQTGRDRDS